MNNTIIRHGIEINLVLGNYDMTRHMVQLDISPDWFRQRRTCILTIIERDSEAKTWRYVKYLAEAFVTIQVSMRHFAYL